MKYLVLPMQPTPNGRMHIGHGGGTYLRADVLARSLREEGHDVRVACGTDAYENWVLAAAADDGSTPEATCRRYHAGILADLEMLDVRFDEWIDPLAEEHRQPYLDLHTLLFSEVTAGSAAAVVSETVPYDPTGLPLVGTFIAGDCPQCGAAMGGSSCTACGQHCQPDELRNPHARLSDAPLVWRRQRNWFLSAVSTRQLLADLRATGLPEQHVAVAQRFLDKPDARVRLSGPGTWGVRSPLLPPDQVLSNSYFLYCLYASQRIAADGEAEPFSSDSDVRTVGVFGSDNSTPGLVVPGLYAQATGGRLRAFDHTVVNGMIDLEGRKCSTSQRYGIWLKDILGQGIVTSDELRVGLAAVDVDNGRANLQLAEFADLITEYRHLVRGHVLPALSAESTAADPDPKLVERQRQFLRPETLNLPAASGVMLDHLRRPSADPAGWLMTLAALAAPLTPGLARALRTRAAGAEAHACRSVAGNVAIGDLSVSRLQSVFTKGQSR